MSKQSTHREVTLAGPIVHRGEPKQAGDKVHLREDQINILKAAGLIAPEAKRKPLDKEET